MSSLSLGTKERDRALREVATYESYGNFMTESITKSTSSKQSTRLQSLQLLARPIGTFIYTFEQLVEPEKVDMSLIWGLIYLNVNVCHFTLPLYQSHTNVKYSSRSVARKSSNV